jgi:hypothetical protein
MTDSATKAAMHKRVHAARERLKNLPKSDRRGPTDPSTGESWNRGHVLGHTAEMMDFWTAQFRAARAGSGEIGRGESGNQKRRDGIDRGDRLEVGEPRREAAAAKELELAVDEAISDLLALLDELTPEDLELEVVFHSRQGDRPARVDELLEMLVVSHLEEHVAQLAALD